MANMLFANNANTTLASSLTNSATTMSVTSASAFPSPTGSQYFYCTLADAATQTTIEIVKVTAVSGTTFTIVRGQDGTTGTIFASGAVVSLRLVRASLQDFALLDEVNTFTQAQTFSVAPITSTLTGFIYGNGASAQTVATNAQLLTLLGTLPVSNGGTGLTSLTANYIPYGNGTGAFSSTSAFTYTSTGLGVGTSATSIIDCRVDQAATTYLTVQNRYHNTTLTQKSGLKLQLGDISESFKWCSVEAYPATAYEAGGGITFNTYNGTTPAEVMRMFPTGGVSIGNTTDPGATNLSVSGLVYQAGTANAITNDFSSHVSTMNNNNTLTITGLTNGFIEIAEISFGGCALILVGSGATTIISQSSTLRFSTIAGTANLINVYVSGSNVIIESKNAATFNVRTNIRKLS